MCTAKYTSRFFQGSFSLWVNDVVLQIVKFFTWTEQTLAESKVFNFTVKSNHMQEDQNADECLEAFVVSKLHLFTFLSVETLEGAAHLVQIV